MERVGITGHQRLEEVGRWSWVREQVRLSLTETDGPLAGLTSLAVGVDQLFAEEVVKLGGRVVAVLPFREYAERVPASERDTYHDLLAHASEAWVLPRVSDADEECYLYAGKMIVENCDRLIAVWDGQRARGIGGTADIVEYARLRGRRTAWINPDLGVVRTL